MSEFVRPLKRSHFARPIAVVAGGHGPEREVSLRSAAAVIETLQRHGENVRLMDPAGESIATVSWRPDEVVFNVLHGEYGEDGQLQHVLDECDVPYTGSGRETSQLAFSKVQSRSLYEAHGHVAAGITWRDPDPKPEGLTCPLVVKPASQGSSVGLSFVEHPDQLEAALFLAATHDVDSMALVEEFVAGEEWTVAVLGRHVFPPVRVEHDRSIFDFDAKYEAASSRFTPLTDRTDPRFIALCEQGRRVAEVFDTRGLVRADFIWTGQHAVFLELNTIPGLTERSLAPLAAAADGVSFLELCLAMLTEAVEER